MAVAAQQQQNKRLIMKLIQFHMNLSFFFAEGERNSCIPHLYEVNM